mgnify:CR=1 FL=1
MNPITGRKHQLRKQLSIIGHPEYGDDKYTFDKKLKDLTHNNASENEIKKACDFAAASDFIKNLQQSYETIIGELSLIHI